MANNFERMMELLENDMSNSGWYGKFHDEAFRGKGDPDPKAIHRELRKHAEYQGFDEKPVVSYIKKNGENHGKEIFMVVKHEGASMSKDLLKHVNTSMKNHFLGRHVATEVDPARKNGELRPGFSEIRVYAKVPAGHPDKERKGKQVSSELI